MASSYTLGIDLAAQPPGTAACLIRWEHSGQGFLERVADGLENEELMGMMSDPLISRVGIDSPFGWPIEFVTEISRFTQLGTVPETEDLEQHRRRLRLRATDREIQATLGLTPLSVSTDRIGVVALRCARLLADYWATSGETPDRSGNGRLLEVYPAAALRQWRLAPAREQHDPGTYKGASPGALRRRQRILRAITNYGRDWLEIQPELAEDCERNDHKLDALVCALVARAADNDQLVEISDPDRAASEGWIRLPRGQPLSLLGGKLATVSGWLESKERLIPTGGYLEVQMPEQFELLIQDRPGGPWATWAVLRGEWFERGDDGSYLCAAHGGSPVYIRALSVDPQSGVIEHVDGDGYGTVYRYRLRPNSDEPIRLY